MQRACNCKAGEHAKCRCKKCGRRNCYCSCDRWNSGRKRSFIKLSHARRAITAGAPHNWQTGGYSETIRKPGRQDARDTLLAILDRYPPTVDDLGDYRSRDVLLLMRKCRLKEYILTLSRRQRDPGAITGKIESLEHSTNFKIRKDGSIAKFQGLGKQFRAARKPISTNNPITFKELKL